MTLHVVPAGEREAATIAVKRADVQVPAVHGRDRPSRTAGSVADVRFSTFSAGAHGELRSAVDRLYRRGAEGLVLDLRGNGGGLLEEAVLAASIFLHKGEVVVDHAAAPRAHRVYRAVGDPGRPQADRGARRPQHRLGRGDPHRGAVRRRPRDTVVGTRTFGKGVFQQAIDLSNGGALDLTIGEYFTADGTSTSDKGIKPDVHAADDPKTEGRRGASGRPWPCSAARSRSGR